MTISLEYLERCSAETGFPVAGLEKVARLGEMAAEVGRHPLLSDVLLLKGGTALNLAFGPPERLSVDLHFNYVGAGERERMLANQGSLRSVDYNTNKESNPGANPPG